MSTITQVQYPQANLTNQQIENEEYQDLEDLPIGIYWKLSRSQGTYEEMNSLGYAAQYDNAQDAYVFSYEDEHPVRHFQERGNLYSYWLGTLEFLPFSAIGVLTWDHRQIDTPREEKWTPHIISHHHY
jgi:hypothetical protein